MATVIEGMGQYVANLRYEDLSERVIDYAKRILLDSLACAYGGVESEPARMVRTAAAEFSGPAQATVLGQPYQASAPFAAVANGVAIRYQDYSDVYFGPAWTAHPSDNLSTVLATAEWQKRSGRDLLLGMVAAYEIQMRFSDLPSPKILQHLGWHHTTACAYAGAAGAGKLLGLDARQMAHALALSGARANTLAQIRVGDIPMDKALSAPIVASQSIFYAVLARQGFTGCIDLMEGRYGFRYAVAGGIEVGSLVPEPGDFRTLKVGIKPYPVEGMTPAMVQAAIEIRNEFAVVPEEIESIRILSHEVAVTKPSWDEAKQRAPTTKETADHSFYYCVAVALVAGEVTPAQFTEEWFRHPAVGALIAKTRLEATPEMTAVFKQGSRPAAVEIKTSRGIFYREVLYPHGDPRNPMTWEDVMKKFMTQAEPIVGAKRAAEIAAKTYSIDKELDIRIFARMLGETPGKV